MAQRHVKQLSPCGLGLAILLGSVSSGCGSSSGLDDLALGDLAVGDLAQGESRDLAMGHAAYAGHFCNLPGSIQHDHGVSIVPGAPASTPDFSWMQLPDGFCVHYYGTVANARQVKVAPSGELFVASPTALTSDGGPSGLAAIAVLPDDDHDGFADAVLTFLPNLTTTQGMLFQGSSFYYQDGTKIRQLAYKPGDRSAAAPGAVIADITIFDSNDRDWPKLLDAADDGSLYVTNGGGESESCDPSRPFHGGVLELDGSMGGAPIAKGFRFPTALACHRGFGDCWVTEDVNEFSGTLGGRAKLVPVRAGDDWGYNCCATQNTPYGGVTPAPDCSGTAAESNSFLASENPVGLDFDLGAWPAPFTNRLFITLEGAAGSFAGARLVAVATDPSTGRPVPSSDLNGQMGFVDFATGWDDAQLDHGRPFAVSFAPDGRLFLANDVNGQIVWIAPINTADLPDGGS